MVPSSKLIRWFPALKAYGDLVIACHHLRQAANVHDFLLCGDHLRTLVDALGYVGNVKWLRTGGDSVPSFFNLRSSTIADSISNALILREGLNRIVGQRDILVFDRMGWRQKFLALGHTSLQIASGKSNIYLDYEQFFGVVVESIRPEGLPLKSPTIGVFPGSRVLSKSIPDNVLDKVIEELRKLGGNVNVYHAGKGKGIDGFTALNECIQSCDGIVSADSLPAHLAEYNGCPSFVLTNEPNNYWLPKSAYTNNWYDLFETPTRRIAKWFEKNFRQSFVK